MFRVGDIINHKGSEDFLLTVSDINEHFYNLTNTRNITTNVSHDVSHRLFKLVKRKVKDTELARFMNPEYEEYEEGWILI